MRLSTRFCKALDPILSFPAETAVAKGNVQITLSSPPSPAATEHRKQGLTRVVPNSASGTNRMLWPRLHSLSQTQSTTGTVKFGRQKNVWQKMDAVVFPSFAADLFAILIGAGCGCGQPLSTINIFESFAVRLKEKAARTRSTPNLTCGVFGQCGFLAVSQRSAREHGKRCGVKDEQAG